MGFTINKEIKTILTYKDIALIAVAMGRYCDELGDKKDDNVTHAKSLVDRLGREMAS